jgi:hypothetical protein
MTRTSHLHPVAELQRVVGNQAVLRMLRAGNQYESRLKPRSTYRADLGVPTKRDVTLQSPDSAAPAGRLYDSRFKTGSDLISQGLRDLARQAISKPLLFRQPVEQYDTAGVPVTEAKIRESASASYWEKKIKDAGFSINGIEPRVFPEREINAALATIFYSLPTSRITQETTTLLTIPLEPQVGKAPRGKKAPKAEKEVLNCEVVFQPTVTPNQKGVITLRLVMGVATGLSQSSSTFTEPGRKEYIPRQGHHVTLRGFPGDGSKYWDEHHEEQVRIFHWVENEAPAKFDQLLTIKLHDRTTAFHLTGTKSNGIATMDVSYFAAPDPEHVPKLPKGYDSHDFSDKEIEDLQSTPDPDPSLADKLGKISGIDKLAPEERASIKVVIWQYFKSNPDAVDPKDPSKKKPKKGTRNKEVDAIVPILNPPSGMATKANTNRSVLVTLRFKPNNDVDVEWIGELNKEGNLERTDNQLNKTVSFTRGSLARVNGFADHLQGATESEKVNSLLAWLKTRYPNVTLSPVTSTTTVKSVCDEVNKQIIEHSGEPAWFGNYGIAVSENGAEAEKQLRTIPNACLQELKRFEASELKTLELVLEKMSDETLSRLKGIHLTRQQVHFEWKGARDAKDSEKKTCKPPFEEQPNLAGITRSGKTGNLTITIFDAANVNLETLFVGGRGAGGTGKLDVEPAPAMIFAHELGHVVFESLEKEEKDKFAAIVKGKKMPITWYAESDPQKELFPEAFALYYSDPQWLHAKWAALYDFFDNLDKKMPPGKPAKTKPRPAPGKR